jgi:lysozyme family protein
MDTNLDAVLAFTKIEEGGYSADPRDSGNWTSGTVGRGILIGSNMGVGAPALVAFNVRHRLGLSITQETMQALDPALYKQIAVEEYWTMMDCDGLPDGVDLMVFDYGWNRGPGNAIHELQETLGVVADGDYGAKSAAAMRATNDLQLFVAQLALVQEKHYRALNNFWRYGKGWLARTARRRSVAMSSLAKAAVA